MNYQVLGFSCKAILKMTFFVRHCLVSPKRYRRIVIFSAFIQQRMLIFCVNIFFTLYQDWNRSRGKWCNRLRQKSLRRGDEQRMQLGIQQPRTSSTSSSSMDDDGEGETRAADTYFLSSISKFFPIHFLRCLISLSQLDSIGAFLVCRL